MRFSVGRGVVIEAPAIACLMRFTILLTRSAIAVQQTSETTLSSSESLTISSVAPTFEHAVMFFTIHTPVKPVGMSLTVHSDSSAPVCSGNLCDEMIDQCVHSDTAQGARVHESFNDILKCSGRFVASGRMGRVMDYCHVCHIRFP